MGQPARCQSKQEVYEADEDNLQVDLEDINLQNQESTIGLGTSFYSKTLNSTFNY